MSWGVGNLIDSPLLMDNYHLDPYSPAIGAGLEINGLITDLNGDPRPNPEGSLPDMGAYESIRALRLLRTTAILDGLDKTDIVLSNDSTSLSAHWKKFENNSLVNYEIAVGTFDENNIKDWQTIGNDTSVTISGLNLIHDSTYFFHVRGFDDFGRESLIISSNGVLIDILAPSVISASEEWVGVNPILGSLNVELILSEPVIAGEFNLSSNLDEEYKIDYKLVDKNKFEVAIFGPFKGRDQIAINLNGLKDRAGTIAHDTLFNFTVSDLGDYNLDGLIDAYDVSTLITGWKNNNYEYELGPTTGSIPYLKPVADGKFDIYDAAALTRMWHWNLNQSDETREIFYSSEGKDLAYLNENSSLQIEVNRDINAVELFIDYPHEHIKLLTLEEGDVDKEIMLSHLDSLNGKYFITLGYLEQQSRFINLPYVIHGDDHVPIQATYRMFNSSGKLIKQGTKDISLKPIPKAFALQQNYPNPFNPVTTINFDLPEETAVKLVIYDLLGREVATLIDGVMPAGYQSIIWNTKSISGIPVAAGVYFYQARAGNFVDTKKMVILK